MFETYQRACDEDQTVRTVLKTAVTAVEDACRQLGFLLVRCHRAPESDSVAIAKEAAPLVARLRDLWAAVAAATPTGKLYRFEGLWSRAAQDTCRLLALHVYLASGRLATEDDLCAAIGCERRR